MKNYEDLKTQLTEYKNQVETLKMEMRHLEEKLLIKNENMLYQKDQVAVWLNTLGILIAFFGIVVPVVGFVFGRKIYRDIEKQKNEAEKKLVEMKNLVEDAKKLLKAIEANKKISDEMTQMYRKSRKGELSDKDKSNMQQKLSEMEGEKDVSPLNRSLKEALELFLSEKYDEAIEKYRAIINNYKKDITIDLLVSIYFNMAYSYFRINQFDTTIRYLDMVIELEPNDARVWSNKGAALAELGKNEDAIKCSDEAIKIDQKYPKAWSNKGFALCNLGKNEDAIKCFDEAIKIDQKYAKAWSNKGFALYNLGNNEEAVKCFDEAIKINPTDAKAWSNKGITLGNLRKEEEAIKCYDEAIKINPTDAKAWSNKGITLGKLGKEEEAIKYFDEAIRIDPEDAEVWSNKGVTLGKLGKYEEAIKCYDEAIRLKPDFLLAYANLMELLIIQNKTDDFSVLINKLNELKLQKNFDVRFLEIVYSKLQNQWNKNLIETVEELKSVANNDPKKVTWPFDEMKSWLGSDKSNNIEKENKEFILSLIKEMENWRKK
jgi:tetratricopeptide (TPR) repeat protein